MFQTVQGRKRLVLCIIWIFLASVCLCFAQDEETGTLTGIVTDPKELVIPDVEVTLVNSETGSSWATKTNSEGEWTVSEIPFGVYDVILFRDGFEQVMLGDIAVPVEDSAPMKTTMQVAGLAETTTVFAEIEKLHTDTAEIGKVSFSEDLLGMTSATRSFTGVMSGIAGVSTDISKSLVNSTGNSSPSVNGARTTSTSLHFNGVDSTNLSSNTGSMDDNISPSVEFLQEVRVQSSMYDAAVGRSGGGNVMLYTKSGEESYHGSGYYYLQNEALNANEYFLNSEGIERPIGRRNQFGATFGGPVPFPGLKNRIKFFAGYERTDAETAYVPTARTLTQLPSFLGLIEGERTEENIIAALLENAQDQGNVTFYDKWVNMQNPDFGGLPVSAVALSILNLKNPVTGDYWIPSPRTLNENVTCNNPYGTYIRGLCDDGTISNKSEGFITEFRQGVDGNYRLPFTQQRILSPATFEQEQYIGRLDVQVTERNYLSVNYFFSDFPSVDPFTDPASQASPVSVKKLNRANVFSVADQMVIRNNLMNEVRFGMYSLRNTRRLDDVFQGSAYTNNAVGLFTDDMSDPEALNYNPAIYFDDSPGAHRLAKFTFKNNISHFSFGASNDAFNKRDLTSYSVSDNASWIKGSHHFKFGAEYKRHHYDTNLPEQQGAEFEFDSFFQFLVGRATEATTRLGVTDKHFTMQDMGYYVTDKWRLTSRLTIDLGLRWDVFGRPRERDGRIANFDPKRLTDPDNPLGGFLVASNSVDTGFEAIDRSLAITARAGTESTLSGNDLNNLAPRFGFAFTPFKSDKLVIRGGYGIFYDRPSAAFINTLYKNYPFMHQIKVGAPHGMVPVERAFSLTDPEYPFASYLPYHIEVINNKTNLPFDPQNPLGWALRYDLRDNVPWVDSYVDGKRYSIYPGTANTPYEQRPIGNSAVPLEFRAVDPDIRTPYVQQWNLGFEAAFRNDWVVEVRYQGSKGTKLLQAISFNQPYDLNDPGTPDHIFARLNDAYEKAYNLSVLAGTTDPRVFYRGPLPNREGWTGTERERGAGLAFGFNNPVTGNETDCNLSSEAGVQYWHLPDETHPGPYPVYTYDLNYSNVIPLAIRTPYLGLDPADATILTSNGNSSYNALQMNLRKQFSGGYSMNLSYTWSKSLDTSSSDPGSGPGTSRPEVATSGNIVMGDQRNIQSSRAVSDFDRPHRFTAGFSFDLPAFGLQSRWIDGWKMNGSLTLQSGAPYSLYAGGQELSRLIQYYDQNNRALYSDEALDIVDGFLFIDPKHVPDVNPLAKSTGGLYGGLFVRPSVRPDGLKALQEMGRDSATGFFNTGLLAPSEGGFGNLGRNALRAAPQSKLDLSLSKKTELVKERANLEIRLDVMNVFNGATYAAPVGDLADYFNLGNVLYTIGGPRVMQASMRLSF
ncbi:MAG: carboxypeptidase regulatory-like domain-containing protein [Acidobacteria bacterium]|nr:carboxypeptidase regulatory-like domain-containing protein [Acidobacteriota bacterium]